MWETVEERTHQEERKCRLHSLFLSLQSPTPLEVFHSHILSLMHIRVPLIEFRVGFSEAIWPLSNSHIRPVPVLVKALVLTARHVAN